MFLAAKAIVSIAAAGMGPVGIDAASHSGAGWVGVAFTDGMTGRIPAIPSASAHIAAATRNIAAAATATTRTCLDGRMVR
jgi:hypothetical protein